MPEATLTIINRNFGSWSLRGWLLCRMAELDVDVVELALDDEAARAELLLLSPSFRVPQLEHDGVVVWDSLAIAEYLNELRPEAGLWPAGVAERARCRSISGEMHAGFANLRSALPMDLRSHHPGYRIYAGAQADIDRILAIWNDCLDDYGGPFLFGEQMTVADAMYAPVCTRFATYDVPLEPQCADYCDRILGLDAMVEWTEAAVAAVEVVPELEIEF